MAATLAVYGRVRSNPFINFDDDSYVVKNSHVRAGVTGSTFAWAWTSTEASNWHPLTWLSHALDCELYGLNPAGHHLTSVLLHSLNVVLLFLLLARVTGKMWRSVMVAGLFALHPLNVETVAWVAERKSVLSTLFFLLALVAYGWYARRPKIERYLLVSVMFALGLASKPMVITLPFALLLLDFWPLRRIQGWSPLAAELHRHKNRKVHTHGTPSGRSASETQLPLNQLLLEKLPLLALSVGSAVITLIAQRNAVRPFTRIAFLLRLQNAAYAYAMYIWKAFWPIHLALFYPHPLHQLANWQIGLAILFLVGVSALVWQQRRAHPYLVTGWLWYLGTLVPVIGIVQVGDQGMADRYAYLPMIGIFVMVVWRLADWAAERTLKPWVPRALGAAVLVILASLTWLQLGYWHSRVALWTHTLQVTDHNVLAENNLADALLSEGRLDDALPHFQNAALLQPNNPTSRANLGSALAESGHLQEAIVEYQLAIQLTPNVQIQSRIYESIAALSAALPDYAKVRESYKQALQADPRHGPDMIQTLIEDTTTRPTRGGFYSLGFLLELAGRLPEARDAYAQALKLDPGLTDAQQSLDALNRAQK